MDQPVEAARGRGRPAAHLLSGIAVCGVCGSAVRVGSQNTRSDEQRHRYRVYECAGSPGSTGFHVSMRQEHLDQIVADAVVERVLRSDFRAPRAHEEDSDGTERRALRLEIKSLRIWLDEVGKEARRRGTEDVLTGAERVVLPKIEAATDRVEELERLDPMIVDLQDARSVRRAWDALPLAQQRHVVRALMVPRINPVLEEERGRRGLNARRVDLGWRDRT